MTPQQFNAELDRRLKQDGMNAGTISVHCHENLAAPFSPHIKEVHVAGKPYCRYVLEPALGGGGYVHNVEWLHTPAAATKPDNLQAVLSEVAAERARQDKKWGANRNLPAPMWHTILSEEVGECAEAVLEKNLVQHRKELVQVAAVAVATIEAVDRELATAEVNDIGAL